MSTIDDGGPAFPVIGNEGEPSPGDGMTLRDYMAIHATDSDIQFQRYQSLTVAEARYAHADAMLAARKGGAA